ncbi:MAG: hypothetical protein HZA90_16060 [Verrucomicrobia bacterium]|nr:hypothetical protein [Verrucomicrobiota bacterium]
MKKKWLLITILVAGALVAWLCFNPPRRFGWCRFGLTTYGAMPRLVSDIQVRADGAVRKVPKTHELPLEQVQWLLDSAPETLIVSIGWNGAVEPDERIWKLKSVEVKILKSKEAAQLFNRLKKEGRRVAIHFHSTC